MNSIRIWQPKRVSLVGGQIYPYHPTNKAINAVQIVNHSTVDIYAAIGNTDPINYPEVKVLGQKSAHGMVVLPAAGNVAYLYAASDAEITLIEIEADNIQIVTTDLTAALDIADRASRELGKVGLQVAGADVDADNPVHVAPGTGATFDVSDRAARAAGKVGLQVADADVAAANPVPVTPGTGATFDVSDRAARAAGKVGLQVADADVAAANPVPVTPGTGAEFDISDDNARLVGKVSLLLGGSDVANANRLFTRANLQLSNSDVGATNPVPVKPGNGITPLKSTFAGAGTNTIKAAAGRVFAIVAKGANVTLQNDAAEVWYVPTGTAIVFERPAECGTSIKVTSDGAGDAFVQYE